MSRGLMRLFAIAALAIGSLALAGPVMAECTGHTQTTSTSTAGPKGG
jgi:hypothetical protein